MEGRPALLLNFCVFETRFLPADDFGVSGAEVAETGRAAEVFDDVRFTLRLGDDAKPRRDDGVCCVRRDDVKDLNRLPHGCSRRNTNEPSGCREGGVQRNERRGRRIDGRRMKRGDLDPRDLRKIFRKSTVDEYEPRAGAG